MHESSHPPKILEFFASRGSAPAFTWYANFGSIERIELSGKVCANHLAKIANYLNFECELDSAANFWIDLPPSWKSVLWATAALLNGADVHFIAPSGQLEQLTDLFVVSESGVQISAQNLCPEFSDADVLVTNRPEYWTEDNGSELIGAAEIEIIALNLLSLAFAWEDELPGEVHDGQAEVMGQPDTLMIQPQILASNWSKYCQQFALLQDDSESPEGWQKQNQYFCAHDESAQRVAAFAAAPAELFCKVFSAWCENNSIVIFVGVSDVQPLLKSEGFKVC